MADEDLTETIEEAAAGPKKAAVDGTDVEAQPIPDLIKADQYLKAKQAALKANFGLRLGRLIPPGSV